MKQAVRYRLRYERAKLDISIDVAFQWTFLPMIRIFM